MKCCERKIEEFSQFNGGVSVSVSYYFCPSCHQLFKSSAYCFSGAEEQEEKIVKTNEEPVKRDFELYQRLDRLHKKDHLFDVESKMIHYNYLPDQEDVEEFLKELTLLEKAYHIER